MVPVVFEVTVLFTAFGIGILFFLRCKMLHGIKEDILEIRQTDDRLLIALETDRIGNKREVVLDILKKNGALEIRERGGHNLAGTVNFKQIKTSDL
jgi:hypothetical protein